MEEAMERPIESLSFEQAMEELESIVHELESNQLTLDKALDLFKRGIALSNYCNSKLEKAQSAVNLLIQDQKGQIRTIPFAPLEEENA